MLNDGFVEGRQLHCFFFQVQVTSCFDQSSHYLEKVQKNNFNPLVQFKNKILTYMHNKYKAYLKVNEPKYTNKYLVCRRKVLEKVFTVIYNAIYWNFEYLMT